MSDNNVVLFPIERIIHPARTPLGSSRPPKNIEEVKSKLELVNHSYINDLLETIIPTIVNQMEAAGFDISTDENVKDGAFLVEAFRSILCKQYGINHPFQILADAIFETEEDGALRVVSKINIELNEPK